jgi:hypothetical protein
MDMMLWICELNILRSEWRNCTETTLTRVTERYTKHFYIEITDLLTILRSKHPLAATSACSILYVIYFMSILTVTVDVAVSSRVTVAAPISVVYLVKAK